MFGVIQLPYFELQAALRQHPDWDDAPVALLDEALIHATRSRQCQIVQVNPPAKKLRVEPGMTAPQGEARCQSLHFLTRCPVQEQIAHDILLQWNAEITPNLEATKPGICTVNLKGTRYASGREEVWAQSCLKALESLQLHATAGIAPTPDLALIAAQNSSSIGKVSSQADAIADFLRPFPIQVLNTTPEIAQILQRWGIKTVGELIALPKQEVVRRLGKECVPLWEQALGSRCRLLHHFQPSTILTESTDLEHPIERLEALIFVLNRFLDQLTTRLAGLYRVAATMELNLRFDDGNTHHHSFRIPEPTRETQRLFRMLHTYLENFRSPSPIVGLSLSITPTRAQHVQLSLFDTNLRDPNRFTETVSRLEALLGPGRVGTPVPTASHRPDSFRLDPFSLSEPEASAPEMKSPGSDGMPLRRFRPPKSAQVFLPKGADAEARMRITFDNLRSQTKHIAGPWKNSGHWWDQKHWDRQEWDIELTSGGVYRLAREQDRWVVDGVYD